MRRCCDVIIRFNYNLLAFKQALSTEHISPLSLGGDAKAAPHHTLTQTEKYIIKKRETHPFIHPSLCVMVVNILFILYYIVEKRPFIHTNVIPREQLKMFLNTSMPVYLASLQLCVCVFRFVFIVLYFVYFIMYLVDIYSVKY